MDAKFVLRTAVLCLGMPAATSAVLAAPPEVTVSVNCDAGRQVADAIDRNVAASRTLIIVVRGTCAENVTIERDNVVLRADPSGGTISAPDAGRPAILVDGARRVTVEGLIVQGGRDGVSFTDAATGTLHVVTVRNAARDGVRIERGSTVTVDASVFENNGQAGVQVNASRARITSSTSRGNASYGVMLVIGATAYMGTRSDTGEVCCGNTIVNNHSDGLIVVSGSTADLSGNDIKNNGGALNRFGILVNHGSTVWLRGGNVVSHNGGASAGAGVFIRGGFLRGGGGDIPAIPPTNDITANAFGIMTSDAAFVDLRNGNVSGNRFTGVVLDHGTRARIDGTTISNNGAHGLFVSHNSSVAFVGAGSAVTGNSAFGLYCADNESSYYGNTVGVTGNVIGDVNCTGF